jgi:hypothetical protein
MKDARTAFPQNIKIGPPPPTARSTRSVVPTPLTCGEEHQRDQRFQLQTAPMCLAPE